MKDYLKKEPTKLEKKINYQFAMMSHALDNANALIVAMARKLMTPEELAEFRVDDKANQEFVDALNDALKAQEDEPKLDLSDETKETLEKVALSEVEDDK